jgi:hypothetical protein
MADVFIAHVEEDADVALEIALSLEEAGYTTWCYEFDSIPGLSYLIQTGKAVEQSEIFVIIISPHSLGSRQVTQEVVRAHESNKHIIPILRDITHVEFQNRQPEWREAIGAAASISISQMGIAGILPRIVSGLKVFNVSADMKTDSERIKQMRRALGKEPGQKILKPDKELPETVKPGAEPPAGELSDTKTGEKQVATSMKCAFHPDRDSTAVCTECGRPLCDECKKIRGGKIYCIQCEKKFLAGGGTPPEKVREKATYNLALRIISFVSALVLLTAPIVGLQYYAESGSVSELIVNIAEIICIIALFLMAIVPQWISTRIKIKLEKSLVFLAAMIIMIFITFVFVGLGPEPPGGW